MKHLKLLGLLALAAVSLRADSYFLIVSGLGGEDQYDQRFTGWASDLTKLLKAEPGAKVDTLSGKDATKANIEAKLRALSTHQSGRFVRAGADRPRNLRRSGL